MSSKLLRAFLLLLIYAISLISTKASFTLKFKQPHYNHNHNIKRLKSINGFRFLEDQLANTTINITNSNDWYFSETIKVGSSNLSYTLLVDTGLSYTWLSYNYSPPFMYPFSCTSNSTTCIQNETTINLDFYQDTIEGYIAQDTVTIGDITLSNQDLILATNISQLYLDYNQYPLNAFGILNNPTFDGYLGLGPNPQANGYHSIIENILNLNSTAKSEQWFSLFISIDTQNSQDNLSELMIQGFNSLHLKDQISPFNYTNSISNTSWTINLTNVTYANNEIINTTPALIASGIPYIAIDKESFGIFWNLLVYNLSLSCIQYSVTNDISYIACTCSGGDISAFPPLMFNVGQYELEIPASSYTQYLGYSGGEEADTGESEDLCLIAVYPLVSSFGFNNSNYSNTWILGTPFLQTYYTIFNLGNMSLGFASSVQMPSGSSETPTGAFINVLEMIGGMLIALCIIVAILKICKPANRPQRQANNEEDANQVALQEQE